MIVISEEYYRYSTAIIAKFAKKPFQAFGKPIIIRLGSLTFEYSRSLRNGELTKKGVLHGN